MLSKKDINQINPSFEPVTRRKLRRDENGKPVLDALSQPIVDLIGVKVFAPELGKYVMKQRRVTYTTTQLNKAFPNQKRNKTFAELFGK